MRKLISSSRGYYKFLCKNFSIKIDLFLRKMMDEIKYLSTLEPFDKENHLVNNPLMKDIVVSKISMYFFNLWSYLYRDSVLKPLVLKNPIGTNGSRLHLRCSQTLCSCCS